MILIEQYFVCVRILILIIIIIVILKRDKEYVVSENFDDFNTMRLNYKCLNELDPTNDSSKICATCFFKDNNFWIYHSNKIEDSEEEKANPVDKLWLIMRHMGKDKEHGF